MINDNQPVRSCSIKKMSQNLYFDSEHHARKAAINCCIDEEIPFIDSYGNYLDDIEKLNDDFFQIAKDDPNTLINNYDVPIFSASRGWVFNFMKKHNFVSRITHYSRRGAIDHSAVEKYLVRLSEAIEHYGPDHVLNMDETQVLLKNFPGYTIVTKGQPTVVIEKGFTDTKEIKNLALSLKNDLIYDPANRNLSAFG